MTTYLGDDSGSSAMAIRNEGAALGKISVLDFAGIGLDTTRSGEHGTVTLGNPVELARANLKPTAAANYETLPRSSVVTTNAAALTSGVLLLTAIALPATAVVTNIVFVSGTQAAVAPLNQWFGLFNSARVALRLTADDTSTAWAASAIKSLALTTPYTVPTTGLYYLGIMVAVTTTVPSLQCQVYGNATVPNLVPILQGSSNTGLTTPPALPFTAEALTGVVNRPYAYVN